MKKWYGNLSAILITALAVQLTGCASAGKTFARWTGRDQTEEEIAEIDGKAATETAAKSRSEARRPAASQASKSKPAPEEEDRVVAKKIDPKTEAKPSTARTSSSVGSSRDRLNDDAKVAATKKTDSARASAARKTEAADKNETAAKTASSSRVLPPKTSTATAPKTERSVDPFAEFEIAAEDSELAPLTANKAMPSTATPKSSVKTAAGGKTFNASVDAEFEEFAANQRSSKIQEVAHRGEESDLPEWASDTVAPKATPKARPAAEQAAPGKTKRPAVTASAEAKVARDKTVAKTAPTPSTMDSATPAATIVVREKYAAMCPDAKGEVRELVRSLDADDPETVKRSIHRLGRMQRDAVAATPALQKLLLHRDSNVRVHSALALVRMNEVSPFVTETLILSLRSPDPSVRSFSAAVLAEMGPNSSEALPALAAALKDSDGFVRLHVAEVLIRHEDYSQVALDSLLKCLKDEDENVRRLATYSLAELAPQSLEAASALERGLSDASPKVCVGAAYALGEIGPMARSATSSLQRCSHSSDPELQAAVAYALRQVQE
jgi:HEAT repeat protein